MRSKAPCFVSALRPARFFVLCIILFSQHRGIAKLVKAPDSDSGIRGFESFFPCHLAESYAAGESPSWLRHRILIPAFEGSNPSSPAISFFFKFQLELTSAHRRFEISA